MNILRGAAVGLRLSSSAIVNCDDVDDENMSAQL